MGGAKAAGGFLVSWEKSAFVRKKEKSGNPQFPLFEKRRCFDLAAIKKSAEIKKDIIIMQVDR